MASQTTPVTAPQADIGNLAIDATISDWTFTLAGQAQAMVQLHARELAGFEISSVADFSQYTVVPVGAAFNVLVRTPSTVVYLRRSRVNATIAAKVVG